MEFFFSIIFGKIVNFFIRTFNLGSGSTWPGHIALSVNKNFIKDLLGKNQNLKVILIAGTNGKTTTGKLIQTILDKNNKKVFQNTAGANLLNGIASALIINSNLSGKIDKDFGIFEIDENTLPLILKEIENPDFIILLNLFRDQLDRYGEIDTITSAWKKSLDSLSSKTTLILNADDPQIASLALRLKGVNVKFFGLNDANLTTFKVQHASDSLYCPECKSKLSYSSVFYSHLGIWECLECKNARPKLNYYNSPIYPLAGIYNHYNTIAAVSLSRQLNISEKDIPPALKSFKPAFGRQENLEINGKKVQIFLSKNPTSLNESLRTIVNLNAKNLLILLNDRIPDGRDVSWIWDVSFEDFSSQFKNITASGDRALDMGLRLKYAEFENFEIEENLEKAIGISLEKTSKNETLYILPTYSAMLEVRRILTGKKIL
ncbi:MAG: DUF1727 domain-containing protein [Candidatus Levybacteria bacterium]|nr:DUF1727 domain-containing protein [Candidatus Levybacteria bacterium]